MFLAFDHTRGGKGVDSVGLLWAPLRWPTAVGPHPRGHQHHYPAREDGHLRQPKVDAEDQDDHPAEQDEREAGQHQANVTTHELAAILLARAPC